ncbi:hypothetical protein EST38_g5097 [Candolleomyces aberdarensis]|uniref:DUF974-domain-containing protein n=1 Tax=Candolleomyces aberdarensis TaxID=2316362 RepID=A0A4V1Q438_9AGAR|nr:hypothetical protein EST38_g5097 [Candolleomyces aberdarensis]
MEDGKPGLTLSGGGTFESVVHHEIKELGQHVLACTVTYRLPPNARPIPGAGEDANDPSLVTFRKFYKFAVTNPLSVKTKVHAAKSPTALLSLEERDKIFLEVHIQNLTQEPMYFERMRFECTENWDVEDANYKDDDKTTSIFSGALAIMQPQDTRQYIYILKTKTSTTVPPTLTPGSITPLGRLDISWRSSFGEPGRLLTSMLTRRIPFPTAPPPASASPQTSRPTSPPPAPRPASPFQNRTGSISQIAHPQSPQIAQAPSQPQTDLDIHLIVKHIPRDDIKVERPFTVALQLVASSGMPLKNFAMRKLVFAIQHLQAPKVSPIQPQAAVPEVLSPRQSSSGFSTPSSATAAFNYALAHQKILDASFRSQSPDGTRTPQAPDEAPKHDTTVPNLPPPYFDGHDELKGDLSGVLPMGSSAIVLPPVQISSGDAGTPTNPIVQDFQLTFVPTKPGFCRVGGLRVLLVQDKGTSDFQEFEIDQTSQIKAQTLKEYDVIAETWVST